MGHLINFKDYLAKKSIDDLEKTLESFDFSNPIIVERLIKDLYINQFNGFKQILEILSTYQDNFKSIKDYQDATSKILNDQIDATSDLQAHMERRIENIKNIYAILDKLNLK